MVVKEGRGRETRKGDGIPFISGRRGGGWLSSRLNTKTSFNSSFDDSLSLPSVRLFPASTPFPPPIFLLSAPHQARNLARPLFLFFFPSSSLFSIFFLPFFLSFLFFLSFFPFFPPSFLFFTNQFPPPTVVGTSTFLQAGSSRFLETPRELR